MGEMAEAILDGIFCEGCGEYMGGSCGHTRRCDDCGPGPTSPAAPKTNPGKVKCRICGKAVKKGQGIKDHLKNVHNKIIGKNINTLRR